MKKALFALLLFFYINPIFSQNSSYVISEGYTYKTNIDYLSKEDEILIVNEEEIIVCEKGTLKEIKKIPIENYPENQKNVGGISFHDEYIMIFSSPVNKKDKTVKFFFRKLDLETGKLSEEELILETANVRLNVFRNGFGITHFSPILEFKLSQDGNKLLFSCREQLRVYNEGMKLSWKTDKVYGKYTPRGFYDLQHSIIDDDGTYYTVIKQFKNEGQPDLKWYDKLSKRERISDENPKPNYDIILLKINATGVSKISTEPLNQKLVHSLILHKDINNELICLGLYFNEKNLDHSLGFFILNLKEEELNYYPIPESVPIFKFKYGAMGNSKYSLVNNKEAIPTEKKGIEYLSNLSVKNTDDGNFLLMCEQHVGYNPAGHTRGGVGNYGHILVAKVGVKGKYIWVKRLPKFQVTTINTTTGENYGCGSYKYLKLKGKHYLIYLDDKQNKDLDLKRTDKYCSSCRNGNIFAYILDDSGNVEKENLFDLNKLSAKTEYNFKEKMKAISDEEFIFPVFLKKKVEGVSKIMLK